MPAARPGGGHDAGEGTDQTTIIGGNDSKTSKSTMVLLAIDSYLFICVFTLDQLPVFFCLISLVK